MSILQAVILGIIQGATEFIPVSSSGHLVITPWILGWRFDSQSAFVFDVLAHWGTLTALLVYFRKELSALIRRFVQGLLSRQPWTDPWSRTAWLILIASLPAAIVGVLTRDFFEEVFSDPLSASGFLLFTALVLSLGEIRRSKPHTQVNQSPGSSNVNDELSVDLQIQPPGGLGLGVALLIGFGQAIALFPGVSRSGMTIAAGVLLGLKKVDAARFSFLLAIPAMLGAGILALYDLLLSEELLHMAPTLLVGFVAAGLVGYAAIRWLLDYLNRGSLFRFAIYCLLLGLMGLVLSAIRS